jgi:hypothetical protein
VSSSTWLLLGFLYIIQVVQAQLDYSLCNKLANSSFTKPQVAVGIDLWKFDSSTNVCSIQFQIPKDMPGPVYMYYRLTNFYQNNRRYVKSFDLKQLGGSASTVLENCDPIAKVEPNSTVVVNGTRLPAAEDAIYYPCGLIANSMFSDELGTLKCINSNFPGINCKPDSLTTYLYPFNTSGVSWKSDSDRFGDTEWRKQPNWQQKIIPPPLWQKTIPEFANGYNETNLPNLKTYERLQVWMRTAGLPNFRKLWGVNNVILPSGTWQMDIRSSNIV